MVYSKGVQLNALVIIIVGQVRLIASSLQNHERVDEGVPDENRITCYQLHSSRHPAGVDQRGDVVLNKPALIASLPCEASKPVLYWRKWTDVAEKVHE
jgi:hypothetical protein